VKGGVLLYTDALAALYVKKYARRDRILLAPAEPCRGLGGQVDVAFMAPVDQDTE
jgi:hypothetical protein